MRLGVNLHWQLGIFVSVLQCKLVFGHCDVGGMLVRGGRRSCGGAFW